MFKALALEAFWSPFSVKTKRQNTKVAKKTDAGTARFVLAVALIAANVMLLGGYVYGVNKSASSGYEIKALQTQLSSLTEDNKKLGLKVAEASSMVSIQNDFLSSNFVAAGTSKFLQDPQFSQR